MSQNPIRKSRPMSLSLKREVLAEAGYRCAVPTCRSILAIDVHHILEVRAGGPHTLSNLLALCPTCHALYTRGTISREAIHAWKTMLVSLNHTFDQTAINHLLFLHHIQNHPLLFSGDGVVPFAPLIAVGLASYHLVSQETSSAAYAVQLTAKGTHLIEAWCSGNREAVKHALNTFV
ncbi:MAG TPA: HNH endonuclease signature motif containing protein [Ktedonobacteraceae bacterium]